MERGVLKVALCQCDVVWESPKENGERLWEPLEKFFDGHSADHLVFPEFFSMGFTMNRDAVAAEGGNTLGWMKRVAQRFDVAVVGSVPTPVEGKIRNRCYFITPDGAETYYDKRHLFRMGQENEHYSAGGRQVVVPFRGWNIALNVCYDLRFPVWSRNVENRYDLLVNIASWPDSRIGVTEHLVKARAIENMSYALFCNRVGQDPSNSYNGHSRVVSPRGEDMATEIEFGGVTFLVATLSSEKLDMLREKFPAWKDADKFEMEIDR